MGYHRDLCGLVEENEVEVIDFGMIDSSEKAYAAVPQILAAGVDVLFCNMVTYATSSVFAPIMREVDKPMVLIALQPRAAMDYTIKHLHAAGKRQYLLRSRVYGCCCPPWQKGAGCGDRHAL